MKIANRNDSTDIEWDRFRFMLFDVPNQKGTYAERYAFLGKSSLPPPSPSQASY